MLNPDIAGVGPDSGQWQALLEAVAGYVWIVGRDLRIQSISAPMPGRDSAYFIGRTATDFVAEAHRQMAIEAIHQVLDGTGPIGFEAKGTETDRWFHVRLSGIRQRGTVTGFVAHMLDVDDIKALALERDLLRSNDRPVPPRASNDFYSQRRLELMADAVPILISYVDKQRRYQYNNASYTRWFGTSRSELRGRDMEEVLGAPAYLQIRGYVDAVLSGRAVSFEMSIPYKNAGLRHVLAYYVPDIQGGEVLGFFALIQDITAQRNAEEAIRQREDEVRQMQKLEALGQLAAAMAHEFNNVLQSVINSSHVVLSLVSGRHPEAADQVALIKRTAERAGALTRELLKFSRPDKSAPGPLDLDELLADMQLLLERIARSAIRLVWELDSGVRVSADAGQIQQVILNLVVNAEDAMPAGGTVTISSRRVDLTAADTLRHAGVRPGRYARVTVTDTGTGMDADVLGRIFEPFFTTKSPEGGTGLGLSTVHRIVQGLGGFIEVDSTPGEGSTFRLYLPCAAGVVPIGA